MGAEAYRGVGEVVVGCGGHAEGSHSRVAVDPAGPLMRRSSCSAGTWSAGTPSVEGDSGGGGKWWREC